MIKGSKASLIEDRETLFRLAEKYEPFSDINNGKTLCKECHLGNKAHGKFNGREFVDI